MLKDKRKIFTSPDGGITVRSRDFGDPDLSNTITITNTGFGELDSRTKLTRKDMIKKYPELAEAWEKYKEVEKHYTAWEELNKE